MRAERAIFTSIPRHGRDGYHLVSRSRGVGDEEARALATWAPSHGGLIVDEANRTSVNFHPLPGGRFALSRTCAGPAEYSGRGGRQLYTHALIVDESALRAVGSHPFALYRHAMAMGFLLYEPDPPEVLEPVPLSQLHPRRDTAFWRERAGALGIPTPDALGRQLESGTPLRLAHAGDRIALAECLMGLLPPESARRTSFSTSLVPSSTRPFLLTLVGTAGPR